MVQVSVYEEVHGGWRHTGWLGIGRRMSGRFRLFADMIGT